MWLDPDENLKNKNQCKIFNLVIVTSISYIYSHIFSSHSIDLNVLQISTES